jgi:TPR repeat protein
LTRKTLFAFLASVFVLFSCATKVFASDIEKLEKARACMKCGHTEEGFKTLNDLASKGQRTAQCLVGMCYQNGKGVPKDSQKAALWYEKAAKKGSPEAQNRLGHMYLNGDEIEKNAVKAEHWLGKAANSGVAEAQYHLGKLYVLHNPMNTKALSKKMLAGRRLILLARDRGVDDSEKLLDQIPGYENTKNTVEANAQKYGTNTAQGMANIETSWEGYAELVKSLRTMDAGAAAPN